VIGFVRMLFLLLMNDFLFKEIESSREFLVKASFVLHIKRSKEARRASSV
jgi:hypothetical protein